ncbi:MFS sugar transporter-like protein [Mollisia scopiformis]|uniref:MFS sugar transporter-like protein n=1 Tax=Mollisia scopiformis TaxID=149040 RepID=A0A194XR89_MOLSC|nr:MFS sugar transporter-like protein [Mollisia scopiformis]KUJ22569.1 MFS sugar transporter-like protein [Mollisia scopiformis]
MRFIKRKDQTPKDSSETKLKIKTIAICAFPAAGGILFGYDSGWIAGILAMDQFKKDFGKPSVDKLAYMGLLYSSTDKSLITSMLSAGTFFGALSAGYIADRIGRKNNIILGCAIYGIGVVLEMIPHGSVPLLTVGRTVAGLGVGLVSATTITYASEITPKQIRGSVVGGYQLNITIGILVAAAINIATQRLHSTAAYRIPIALQFLWALILGIGLLFMPESPRYLVMKDRKADAKKALSTIWGEPETSDMVENEYKLIEDSYTAERDSGAAKATILDCFRGGCKSGSNLHRTFIGISIQMFQQLTGVNFIFYYGTTFFQRAGIQNAFVVSIITASVNVVSTPIALWAIEWFGRRPLLIWGALGMCICQFIVAIVGTIEPDSEAAQKTLITFVSFFIFFFASTWGPVAWTVCGEMYPQKTRSQSTAVATASNWLFNFVIGFVAPYLVDEDKADLGAKIFFIFGGCDVLCFLYAFFGIYETKGLSLEDVDRMMKETSARHSAEWNKWRRAIGEKGDGSSDKADLTEAEDAGASPSSVEQQV